LRALRSARGYSISETAVQSRVGKKQTFTLAGVVAAPSSEERLTLRVTARRGRTSQTDIVEIKASAWIKRASVDRTWKRVNASRVDSLLGPLRNPLTEGSGSSVSRLKTVGPATFHGVSVWHVRWTESRGSLSGTVDALIAKKGFLPYRTIRSLVGGATKAHLADRITRSRFGERTHIRPPTG
jgi:hypothetical protein